MKINVNMNYYDKRENILYESYNIVLIKYMIEESTLAPICVNGP